MFTDFALLRFDFGDFPVTDCMDPLGLSVWYESKPKRDFLFPIFLNTVTSKISL